jgi:hypothetical protein
MFGYETDVPSTQGVTQRLELSHVLMFGGHHVRD